MDRLKLYGTCSLADACFQLGINCHLRGLTMRAPLVTEPSQTHRIVGPAHTVRMVPAKGASVPSLPHHHVDVAAPGSVIVLSAPDSGYGCWGGLMSRRAKKIGCQGVVVDGNCRDLEESRELQFSVFSKDVTVLGVSGMMVPQAINEPITCCGVLVRPGDFVHADVNGVICIPADRVEEVLHLVEQLETMDKNVAEALDRGDTIKESFKRHRTKPKPFKAKL
eukprot:GILJ01011326.1.p1 GENE.GILJ01011326.1~~GILJ01011326.1.p1  ORF type:complete len:222 (-),score=20.95 GILJ01011326.1:142-807(-)